MDRTPSPTARPSETPAPPAPAPGTPPPTPGASALKKQLPGQGFAQQAALLTPPAGATRTAAAPTARPEPSQAAELTARVRDQIMALQGLLDAHLRAVGHARGTAGVAPGLLALGLTLARVSDPTTLERVAVASRYGPSETVDYLLAPQDPAKRVASAYAMAERMRALADALATEPELAAEVASLRQIDSGILLGPRANRDAGGGGGGVSGADAPGRPTFLERMMTAVQTPNAAAAQPPGVATRALAARRQVQSVARDIMILLRTYDDVAPHVEVVSNGVRGVLSFAESQPMYLFNRATGQSPLGHSGGMPEIDWVTHASTIADAVAHVAEAKRLQAAYRADPTSSNALAFARSMGALVSGLGASLEDAPFPLSLYARVLAGCDGAFFAAVSSNLLHSVRTIERIDADTRETGRATTRGR